MKKNTFKIKNHFANVFKLALVILFISVFSEVKGQSNLVIKNDGTNTISSEKATVVTQEAAHPITIPAIDAKGAPAIIEESGNTEGNISAIGTATVNPDGSVKMSDQPSEKATGKNKKSANKPESK
jgi:hypothetical protein